MFSVSDGLIEGCAAEKCTTTTNLSRCAACKAVDYCGREHQVASRPGHRSACNKIKKASAHLDKEERALKRTEGDDIFENSRGQFEAIYATQEYLRARSGLVKELMTVNTRQCQETVLDHLEDMLQLCRNDAMGVRDPIPAVYMRLGREQDCYDFIKWWSTRGQDADYDWENMDLPYLDVKNADVFEGVEQFVPDHGALSHDASLTLLKIRLMIDVQAVQRARKEAGPHVPREVLDEISNNAMSSSIANKGLVLKCDDLGALLLRLKAQVEQLHAAIKTKNHHFWPMLLRPGDNLEKTPSLYRRGDKREMQLVLQYSYNAWMETPGAIDVIRMLEKQDTREIPCYEECGK